MLSVKSPMTENPAVIIANTIQSRRVSTISVGSVSYKIKPMNKQGEYYLTDTIGILRDQGHRIEGIIATDPNETIGINTLAHLATAEAWIEARKKD